MSKNYVDVRLTDVISSGVWLLSIQNNSKETLLYTS